MKSKTFIDMQAQRKTNPEVVETIILAKKHEKWLNIAGILASPRRNKIAVNVDRLNKESKEGDTILVPGKILGEGNIDKKIRVVALNFSKEAREKLKAKKCEIVTIKEEIKLNPKSQGVKLIQ